MGTFFAVFWRETTIGALLLFIVLANQFYVNTIKLERDLAEARNDTLSYVIENQSKRILEASEDAKRIVESRMENLDSRLDRLTVDQREQIRDLLEVDIPANCDELNEFLIDMTDQLRWNNE